MNPGNRNRLRFNTLTLVVKPVTHLLTCLVAVAEQGIEVKYNKRV